MFGYLTSQYHLQTQFAVLIVRTMHQTSIHMIRDNYWHISVVQEIMGIQVNLTSKG